MFTGLMTAKTLVLHRLGLNSSPHSENFPPDFPLVSSDFALIDDETRNTRPEDVFTESKTNTTTMGDVQDALNEFVALPKTKPTTTRDIGGHKSSQPTFWRTSTAVYDKLQVWDTSC